jgi:hypothetical protein
VPAAIDLYVLDALANDIEGFDDILRLLNSPDIGWVIENHGQAFVASEVVAALARTIKAGWVRALVVAPESSALQELDDFALPASPLESCYYMITPRGSIIHSTWEPTPDAP